MCDSVRTWLILVVVALLSRPLLAEQVTVHWSAAFAGEPLVNTFADGSVSGTLGTFEVDSVGDTFALAKDGSLELDSSGFSEPS